MEDLHIDNVLQDLLEECNIDGRPTDQMCKMLSNLNLDEKETDNLKIVQDVPGCDKEREIMLLKKLKDAKEDLAHLYSDKVKAEQELEKKQKVMTKLKKQLSKELSLLKAVENDCDLLGNSTEYSPEDQFKIEKYKTINMMFKQCTGIRWDFTAPENVARGYIKNKAANNLHTFNFSTDSSTISEKMWTLVENTSHPDWSSFTAASDKENSKPK